MSNAQQKADFIVGVVKNAILDGWTKEQFLSISESAWDFLSTPGPGQWGPMQDQPTLETKTEHAWYGGEIDQNLVRDVVGLKKDGKL